MVSQIGAAHRTLIIRIPRETLRVRRPAEVSREAPDPRDGVVELPSGKVLNCAARAAG